VDTRLEGLTQRRAEGAHRDRCVENDDRLLPRIVHEPSRQHEREGEQGRRSQLQPQRCRAAQPLEAPPAEAQRRCGIEKEKRGRHHAAAAPLQQVDGEHGEQ